MTRPSIGGLVLVVAVVAAFGLLASLNAADPEPRGDPDIGVGGPSAPPQYDGGGGLTVPIDLALVAGGLLTAVVAVVGYLFVTAGRTAGPASFAVPELDDEDDGDDQEPDLDAVGDAAGAAADRIEGAGTADRSNDVYRAWFEMTGHLSVSDPETTSPEEFADRAVRAGMDPDDVRRLTRLFEEVRYGEFDPVEREEQAVTALRRIEAAYGSERRTGATDRADDGGGGDG